MRYILTILTWLLLTIVSEAQTLQPAQLTITPKTMPEVLQVLDNTGMWVMIGNVDPTAHSFTIGVAQGGTGVTNPSLVAGSGIAVTGPWPNQTVASTGVVANTTLTSGFSAGQLLLSDGSKVQPSIGGAAYAPNTPLVTNQAPAAFVFNYGGLATFAVSNFQNVPALSVPINGIIGFWDNQDGVGAGPAAHLSVGLVNDAFSGGVANTPGLLAQRNYGGQQTAPQAFRVYNTWSDINNGEWAALDWKATTNVLTIGSQANGTGVQHPINLVGSALQINGTVGVSCAAGTVTLATLVVKNGIIIHC